MAKKKGARASRPKSTTVKARGVITEGTIMITADKKALQAAMQKCLKDSGKVTFRLQDVSVTKLGRLVDLSNIVN